MRRIIPIPGAQEHFQEQELYVLTGGVLKFNELLQEVLRGILVCVDRSRCKSRSFFFLFLDITSILFSICNFWYGYAKGN